MNSTEPDLQTVTDVVVLNADDRKSGLNTEQILEEGRVRDQDTLRNSELEDPRARNWLVDWEFCKRLRDRRRETNDEVAVWSDGDLATCSGASSRDSIVGDHTGHGVYCKSVCFC